MIRRYMVAHVENVNNRNLYAVLDYNRDLLITWAYDKNNAEKIADALEKEEENFIPFE